MPEIARQKDNNREKFARKEAQDREMAKGMDTQAILPVIAMAAEILSMLCFRWVSVPDLKYSPYSSAGMLWKLEETAVGIAWACPVPETMTRAAEQTAALLRLGMAAGILLGVLFIILEKGKGCRFWPDCFSVECFFDRGCFRLGDGYEYGFKHIGREREQLC